LCILMVSADDDMRPFALMEHSPESLETEEICRGRLHRAGENGYGRKSFDIITSLQLWPTLVEICYFQRGRKGLPQTRVNNRRK
jgi:hypothetical protein